MSELFSLILGYGLVSGFGACFIAWGLGRGLSFALRLFEL